MDLSLGPLLDPSWPWAGLLGAGVLMLLLGLWSRRPRQGTPGLLLAHTERLQQVPRYRSLVRRRRRLMLWRIASLLLLAGGALVVIARPTSVQTATPPPPSRDLILCLDASGSMEDYSAGVVSTVREVLDRLPRDRVGLTIFNGASVVKFPLTDDRSYVEERLREAEVGFASGNGRYAYAASGSRSSQIGDGTARCVRGFDNLEDERARIVLVASDNDPFGPPVETLDDASRLARDLGVVVHGLGVPSLEADTERLREFEEAVNRTGGTLTIVTGPESLTEVVERITGLRGARLDEVPRVTRRDTPDLGLCAAVAGVLAFLLTGPGRRR